jgi:hypothetical protein
MAASKKGGDKKGAEPEPKHVRKSVTVDPDKLAWAREALGVSSDAEVLRLALDHLLEHFPDKAGEEE